jgi:GNAT superfamily N-acetyltransferase
VPDAPPGLGDILQAVERGDRLPTDPCLLTIEPPSPHTAAVLAFTGLSVIVAAVEPDWVAGQLPADDLSAPLNPPFLRALEQRLSRRVNNIDIVLTAPPLAGAPPVELTAVADVDHPRVRRAHRYRDEVSVYQADGVVLIVGRGLGGRWEVAVEVDEPARGRGVGRELACAARHLIPDGRPVWAQIAPGNAASVRAFLAAGYRPVGAEALLV